MNLKNKNTELSAIIDYLSKTWDGLDDKSIAQVWNVALYANRNAFDQYAFNDFNRELIDKESSFFIDGNLLSISKLILSINELNSFERDNYINKEVASIENIISVIPSDARPKDWVKVENLYPRFEDYKAYCESLPKVKFNGSVFKFESTFESMTSLSSVMYYATEQDYNPTESLFSAILSQARNFMKEHNGKIMLDEWKNQVNSSELQFKEPLNLALKSFINLPEDTKLLEADSILKMNNNTVNEPKKIKP